MDILGHDRVHHRVVGFCGDRFDELAMPDNSEALGFDCGVGEEFVVEASASA